MYKHKKVKQNIVLSIHWQHYYLPDHIMYICKIINVLFLIDITAVLQKEPDQHDLLNILATIDAKWQEIGLGLNIRENDLSDIADKSKSNTVRLSAVLQKWMETSTSITWQTIIVAIGGPIVRSHNKATEICRFLAEPENYSKYDKK